MPAEEVAVNDIFEVLEADSLEAIRSICPRRSLE